MADQASRLRNLVDRKTDLTTRIIAVTSGKGGVGKTNLALNLSIGLQNAGHKVLLIDADIGMANINLLLGNVTKHSLVELMNYKTRVEDVAEDSDFGIKYISGVAGVDKMLDASHEHLRAIQRKIIDAAELADIIVIDTGAGLNRYVIDFILFAREILLVTTSEPAAIADAYAVVKACTEYGCDGKFRLLVNRVKDSEEWKETAERLNQTTQKFLNLYIEPLGYVYEDDAVSDAVKMQVPFFVKSPDSPASRCIRELVSSLLTGMKMRDVSKGWKNIIKGFFR